MYTKRLNVREEDNCTRKRLDVDAKVKCARDG